MKIKRFDKDLKCRGFQFEIGKIYDTGATDDEIKLYSNKVFHYCDNLAKVHKYYSVKNDTKNRFCEIEVLGTEISDTEICGSNRIRIIREITGEELNVLINGNTGYFNNGNYNSGNYNIGSYNSGNCNNGNNNSGNGNSGWNNNGNFNNGDGNNGSYNSGHCNNGHFNSGMFNSCNYSSGFFCTKEPKLKIFDIETDITIDEFYASAYYDVLTKHTLHLTEWKNYSEAEMANDKNKKLIGGYLKRYTYKEACQIWWEKYTEAEKTIIMSMPNFDKEKFKYITGIDVTKDKNRRKK